MTINKLATVAVALALPAAAWAAPAAAGAHGKGATPKPHHSKPDKRRGATSHTISFTAQVVRASTKGLVVRTPNGKLLSFSAHQIKHRGLPKHHRRATRPGLAHDVNLQVSGGNVVVNILGLQPGALVQIIETINPDGTVTVTITLPAPGQQTEQNASGVVTDLGSDTFTVSTEDGSDLRLHMAESSLSQAGLSSCDTVDVTYHQDGGLLVADSVNSTGASSIGDCAPSEDASGTITAISSDAVTVSTDSGSVTAAVDPTSGLTDGYQVGDVVDVTYSQASDGTLSASDISYVEDDTSGQVTSVTNSSSGGSVTITDDNSGSDETFSANPGGVDVHGQAFKGVQPGDQIEVTYHTAAGQLVADTVSEQ